MRITLYVVLLFPLCARGDTLVSPSAESGNSSSVFPFLIDGSTNSIRYQQVYASSDFAPLAAHGGGNITAISFKVDQSTIYMLPVDLANVQITLSTTLKTPDNLDPSFSANIGADVTTVYGTGPLHLPGTFGLGFILTIPLTTPFYYDALPGHNLLLDVRNYSGKVPGGEPVPPSLDAANTLGDSISSLYGLSVDATEGIPLTRGLLTQFTYTPVPEPNALLLSAMGLGLVLCFRWVARCSGGGCQT